MTTANHYDHRSVHCARDADLSRLPARDEIRAESRVQRPGAVPAVLICNWTIICSCRGVMRRSESRLGPAQHNQKKVHDLSVTADMSHVHLPESIGISRLRQRLGNLNRNPTKMMQTSRTEQRWFPSVRAVGLADGRTSTNLRGLQHRERVAQAKHPVTNARLRSTMLVLLGA